MKFLIIFGGISYEHEISIVSAIAMRDVLLGEVEYIFLDEFREFYKIPTNVINSKMFATKEYKKYPKVSISHGGFFQKSLFGTKKIDFDIAINLVHGGDGEDGKLASILEFFNIKAITPNIESSVISFNKHLTKLYAKELGVKVLNYEVLKEFDKRHTSIPFPIIIKPLRLGSSIGVAVANSLEEFNYALDVAFEFDKEVLIEPFVSGVKEYNLAGTKIGDEFLLSRVEEPEKEKLLDFNKKYLDFSRVEKREKADIDIEIEKKIINSFKKIYGNLFDGAIIRCDFFYHNNEVILNEINPIPGSLANYLFSDFNSVIEQLANAIPKQKSIKVEYNYINSIVKVKGK